MRSIGPNLPRVAAGHKLEGDATVTRSILSGAPSGAVSVRPLEPLEQMPAAISRRLNRNKALDPGRVQGRLMAARDGVEVLAGFSRCCEFYLQRRVTAGDPQGRPARTASHARPGAPAQTRHFYFAQKAKFLFCVDNSQFRA